MYILDKENNKINKVESATFHELGYKERKHLQEWIAKNPDCLCSGEADRLLIIQKEFDGFNDTRERLDLLAVDQDGALVVIENKLDDTGRDVTWQSLKYVSYCSTLTARQIIEMYQVYLDLHFIEENAKTNLVDFFEGKPIDEIPLNIPDQRIILVAGKFRKEVTSTAMWMLDHSLRIQCFRAIPYKWNDDVFVDIEQIIPVKEAEDYIIKMADKNREKEEQNITANNMKGLRKAFWFRLLDEYNRHDDNFKNVNPTDDHWLSGGSGVSGCGFNFTVTKSYASVELYIGMQEKEQNKKAFDMLFAQKDSIEKVYGTKLTWERLDEKKGCRIIERLHEVDIRNEDNWDKIIDFLCRSMPKLISACKEPLRKAAGK